MCVKFGNFGDKLPKIVLSSTYFLDPPAGKKFGQKKNTEIDPPQKYTQKQGVAEGPTPPRVQLRD